MNKFIVSLALLLSIPLMLIAQDRGSNERVEALRVAFITDKLQLTPEEAQKFWPIYNEYLKKEKELRKEYRPERGAHKEELSAADAEKMLQESFEKEAKALELKKEYYNRLKTAVPVQKVARLSHVERSFKQHLLRNMQERKGSGQGPKGHRGGGGQGGPRGGSYKG
jgi:hypothetical protein